MRGMSGEACRICKEKTSMPRNNRATHLARPSLSALWPWNKISHTTNNVAVRALLQPELEQRTNSKLNCSHDALQDEVAHLAHDKMKLLIRCTAQKTWAIRAIRAIAFYSYSRASREYSSVVKFPCRLADGVEIPLS